jgi:hypothetical protein
VSHQDNTDQRKALENALDVLAQATSFLTKKARDDHARAVSDLKAYLAPAELKPQAQAEGSHTAWMVEQVVGHAPAWFTGLLRPIPGSERKTADFSKAPDAGVRYPTREAAQAALHWLLEQRPRVCFQPDCYAITEHQWIR